MFRFTTLVSVLLVVQIPSSTLQARDSRHAHHPRILHEPCRGQEEGKFVKDRYACDKFFYCGANHEAISVDCPHGMIFNDEKEICDFPWNHLCIPEKREEDPVKPTDAPTSTKPTTRPPRPTTTKQTIKPTHPPRTTHATSTESHPSKHTRCPPKDSSRLVFLPDRDDCHRYYICYYGHPMALECIQELHWNQRLERCDFPENANCSVRGTTTVMPPLRTTVAAAKAAGNCPTRGEEVLPHPEQCNYFIYCVNGFATVQQCPFFHHFDVQSKSCMWQTVAKCGVKKRAREINRV